MNKNTTLHAMLRNIGRAKNNAFELYERLASAERALMGGVVPRDEPRARPAPERKRRTTLEKADYAKMQKLRNAGVSCPKIGKMFEVAPQTVALHTKNPNPKKLTPKQLVSMRINMMKARKARVIHRAKRAGLEK